MKRNEVIRVRCDGPTRAALLSIARSEFEANTSMALRAAVREAAARRGLVVALEYGTASTAPEPAVQP